MIIYRFHRADPADPTSYVAPEVVTCEKCGLLVAIESAADHTWWHEGG